MSRLRYIGNSFKVKETLTNILLHATIFNMGLPKELTAITPLSKILAAILFIALPFVGFLIGTRYQEKIYPKTTITSYPTPTPKSGCYYMDNPEAACPMKDCDKILVCPTPYIITDCFGPKGSKIVGDLYLLTRSEPECSQLATTDPLLKQAVNGNKVQVYIMTLDSSFVLSAQMGSQERRNGNIIQASIYIDKLLNLASDPKIRLIRLPDYGITQ